MCIISSPGSAIVAVFNLFYSNRTDIRGIHQDLVELILQAARYT